MQSSALAGALIRWLLVQLPFSPAATTPSVFTYCPRRGNTTDHGGHGGGINAACHEREPEVEGSKRVKTKVYISRPSNQRTLADAAAGGGGGGSEPGWNSLAETAMRF